MRVYIAAPLYTIKQRGIIKEVESLLREYDIEYYSPMRDGVLIQTDPKDHSKEIKRLYKNNIDHMNWCDIIIGILDESDVGTSLELGYCKKADKIMITYSTKPPVFINLMIKESTNAHANDIIELESIIKEISKGNSRNKLLSRIKHYNNFKDSEVI